jgi:hypothetical protein
VEWVAAIHLSTLRNQRWRTLVCAVLASATTIFACAEDALGTVLAPPSLAARRGMRRWSITLCWLLSAVTISSAAHAGSAYASELPSQCPFALGARAAPAPESEPSAQADAAAMLAEVPLPTGSSESSTDPPEAGSLLAGPAFGPPATPNAVDEHAWWLVPVTPAETLAYICTHLPPSTTRPLSFGGGQNVPENMIAGFTWPGSPGALAVRAVRLANGSTALRVDAEVVWVTPRPATEKIPAGARLLTISVHSWARRSSGPEFNRLTILRRLPSRVTSVARIEKIVTLLNELRVHQPGRSSCLLELAGGSAQLSFSTSPHGPPLVVADINTVDCGRGGVSLTIDGMAEPELEGGWSLVEEISQALGIRPAPEKPKPHRHHHQTHL